MPKDRRHASIMFTDIVGYTSLMGADEDRAFEVLSKNREIHQQLVEKFNGTLIKEMGDGMLISFNLASDAVRCAIEIQKKCKEQDIPLKIGIHEGEMVFEGADVIGDAVNVASRLESDTQEGCITISGKVYSDIKNRKDIQTKFIKEKTFKNVDEPIRVYEVLCEEEVPEQKTNTNDIGGDPKSKKTYYIIAGIVVIAIAILFIWKSIPSREVAEIDKSIAVKPFWNESSDQENEYFVNGMMEDIRNNLSKIPELRVISRTTMEKYRDTNMSSSEIGKELSVSYLLEGSVQKLGNQVKIHAQLILAGADDHIWEETYIKDISDVKEVFIIQSDIAQTIANEIGMNLSSETSEVIESFPTTEPTAYDYYLKGNDYVARRFDKDDFSVNQMYHKAEEMYGTAVEIDSNYVLAWVGLAMVNREIFWRQSRYWFHPKYFKYSKEDFLIDIQPQTQKTKGYLDKAIALAPDKMEVRREEAVYYIQCVFDYPKAIQILKRLHVDYPKDDQIVAWIAFALGFLGEYEKSLEYYRKALALNPSERQLWSNVGESLEILRRYDEAGEYYKKAALKDASRDGFSYSLFNLYRFRKKITEAKQYVEEYKEIFNENQLSSFNRQLLWAEGYFEEVMSEIEKYPIDTTRVRKGFDIYQVRGRRYLHIGQKEKATENYQKAKDIFESLPDTLKGMKTYGRYASVLAGLGMTTQALDTINKVIEVLDFQGEDISDWQSIHWEKTFILATSDDHDALFNQIEYILDRYGGSVYIENFKCSPSQIKCDPFWSRFNEYERFQEILNNPEYQEIPLEN